MLEYLFTISLKSKLLSRVIIAAKKRVKLLL